MELLFWFLSGKSCGNDTSGNGAKTERVCCRDRENESDTYECCLEPKGSKTKFRP